MRIHRSLLISSVVFLIPIITTGCGAGKSVISGITFSDHVVGDDLTVSMDATLASGGISLPAVTLPLYNPKNPGEFLGQISTNGLHIIVEVNASAALKLPNLADGHLLPNGAPIPMVLPAGLNPVAIPVFQSSSQVYLAVNGSQIFLGVAVSIAKEDSLNLPISIFLPFNIANGITGNGGFYLGEKQGVAIFALKDAPASATLAAKQAPAGSPAVKKSSSQKIKAKEEPITYSKAKRLQKTWEKLRRVRID